MKQKDLTTGSVLGNILSFSLPYMLAYFLQTLYGLADLYFIGRYCEVDAITAVANGTQVMHMVTCVLIGLAMGTTVCTARAVGARDAAKTAQAVGNTVTLFSLLSLILAAGLIGFCRDIVMLVDTPPEAVRGTVDYLTVCFLGIPFIVAYNVIASIYRGLGDSRSPMYFVAVACVVNILLDILFIGQWNMGPAGAALATTLSQMVSVLIALAGMRRSVARSAGDASSGALRLSRADLKPHRATLREILNVGVPVALQDGFVQIAFIAIMMIANGRGVTDAAAVGIVEKFIGLLFIVPSAMLSTVSAISAQNIGAGSLSRARATLRQGLLITIAFGMVSAVVLQFIPESAVALFTSDPAVIVQGADYLRGYVWDCIFAGIHFCYSGFFTACGLSIISFAHNVASIVVARVPLAYWASAMYPHTLFPMGLATVAGSVLSVLICIVAYGWLRRRRTGIFALE